MKLTLSNINEVYHAKKCSIETMELKGYELIKNLFVDSSGFGAPDEPAYTQSQFMQELTTILKTHDMVYATITDAGQFQVYVGLFKRTGKRIAKIVANNTLEVQYPDRKAIRLHDTDIVTFKGDKIILDNGGYETRTTKARMNDYISPYYISQKNWEWYVHDIANETIIPYKNGMELSI